MGWDGQLAQQRDNKRNFTDARACNDCDLVIGRISFLGFCQAQSKLKNFGRLSISRYITLHGRRFLGDYKSVQLRLDYGLGQLESLRHLEAPYFDGFVQDMTMAKAQWMEEHWKAVRTVRGVFTNSPVLNKETTTFFKNTLREHAPSLLPIKK